MKRKAAILLLLVVAATATVVIWKQQATLNYRYQGKSVRDWSLELYASFNPHGTNAAALAFRAMGSNAVPALCALANLREPLHEKAFVKYARRIPAAPRRYLDAKIKPGEKLALRIGALRALGIIGPEARAALPEMLTALEDADARIRWVSAQSIIALGPEAITALLPVTTNADVNLRHAAVYSLGEAGTNALPATLHLIRSTLDPSESVRASAVYSLSRIGRAALPQIVAQADTNADPVFRNAAFRSIVVLMPPPTPSFPSSLTISTNSAEVRRLAILSLSRSRLTNQHALNLFTNGLNDEAPIVRDAAQLALQRITTGKLR